MRFRYLAFKAPPLPVDRMDMHAVTAFLAQRPTHGPNPACQRRIGNGTPGPDQIHQLLLGDQPSAALYQRQQQPKHLGFHRHGLAFRPQFEAVRI